MYVGIKNIYLVRTDGRICRIHLPVVPGSILAGMWITADFRLYPPVITSNQELVSPTGDHRYRGGTERARPRGFRV